MIWSYDIDFLLAGAISGLLSFGGIPAIGQTIGSKDLEGDWLIQIVASQDVNANVLFEQKVTLTVNVVFMAFSILGVLNMGFASWAFKKEKIETTIFGGKPVNEIDRPVTFEGGAEFGTMERGGGLESTDREAIVSDRWDSPAYRMSLPVGARLIVKHAGASGGKVSRNLLFLFRFLLGGRLGIFLDKVGAIREGFPIGSHIYIGHTFHGPSERELWSDVGQVESPFLWKSSANRLFMAAKKLTEGAYKLWFSDTDGLMPMVPLRYDFETAPADDLEGMQVALPWDGSYSVQDVRKWHGGNISCAKTGQAIFFALSPDNVQQGAILPTGYSSEHDVYLPIDDSGPKNQMLIIADGHDLQIQSLDGGQTWQAVA